MEQSKLLLESRLSKVEVQTQAVSEDIKEIKKTLKWIMGILFSLHSAGIGIMTKGFGLIS